MTIFEVLMKTIPAGQFKAHCLAILDEVAVKRERIVVTKHGKSVAQIIPCPHPTGNRKNPLKNSIVFEKNIIDPVDVVWEEDR
jgi:antitoxin (DNA-binding transcriptional repressor) of toxin-antitoxin stability system